MLRNKLLLFRFRNLNKRAALSELVDRTLEPRINQIFVPLLSIIEDENARSKLRAVAHQCQREMMSERNQGAEAQVLKVIQDLLVLDGDTPLAIKGITERFTEPYGDEYQRKITARWIGYYVSRRLHLKTQRTRDGYIVPGSETPRLKQLFERHGLAETTANQGDATGSTFTRSPNPKVPPS